MKNSIFLIATILIGISLGIPAAAQTRTFTYQGRLTDSSLPANGTYDFQFILLTGSPQAQVGPTLLRPATTVTNGAFSVQLDFTVAPTNPFLSGSDMVLQIGVKKPADGSFTILTPNQPITSAPYAIRSAASGSADLATDSQKLGGVDAAQYVVTTDTRMTDARNPLAGSNSYIQNQNSTQQFANFAINGTGFARIFNAASEFDILSQRVFVAGFNSNTFVGNGAGLSNTNGSNNTFTGQFAGLYNTSGASNSFTGNQAGTANTTGGLNSFFGSGAGLNNTTGSQNSFVGQNAGQGNSTGIGNSFFGQSSGMLNNADANSFFGTGSGASNTNGIENSFFGYQAGNSNTTGFSNSYFGYRAGQFSSTGIDNSFFGDLAGRSNTTGSGNGFFGYGAGQSTTIGSSNNFFGQNAGTANVDGHHNSFFGDAAGKANTTGSFNSFYGFNAGISNTTGNDNAFFGTSAGTSNTNSGFNSFFGANAGIMNTDGDHNAFFGNAAGSANTQGAGNSFFGANAGQANTTGGNNTFVGAGAGNSVVNTRSETGNTMIGVNTGYQSGVINATAIGTGAVARASNTINLGISTDTTVVGFLQLTNIGGVGGTALCVSNSGLVSACGSSLRYKKDLAPFNGGVDLVKRFQPMTFTWNNDGIRDLGLVAEDVEKIDPLLVTYNKSGEIQGVKYDRIGVVLLNAVRDQQSQIESLNQQLGRQQAAIDSLRSMLCAKEPDVEMCKNPQ